MKAAADGVRLTSTQADLAAYVIAFILGDDVPNERQDEGELRILLAALTRGR